MRGSDCIQADVAYVGTRDVITAGYAGGNAPRDRSTYSRPGCETIVASYF